jgi:ATP-binding protein involved in chromosome partitioning
MNNQLAAQKQAVEKALDSVIDPITGKGLLASGRVNGLELKESGKVSFTIEAPAGAAERFAAVRDRAEQAVRATPGITHVLAVLTAHDAKSAQAKAGGLGNVQHVIAVASAKGGVGKSTVAANLACAFAALGYKTGLLDLDVYGPSAPTLFGVRDRKPQQNPDKSLAPIEAHGVRTMSIGYLVDPASPMIWRGAMATSAVRQMVDDVAWGELDVLLLDLPPGTGDVQLTLVQRVPLAGAIIVSTPQEMALADVRRGIAMFDKTRAPVLGVIENMAYFQDSGGARVHIFGQGGARKTAADGGVPFFGEIPIDVGLRESADAGLPLVASQPDNPTSRLFVAIARDAIGGVASLAKPAPTIRFS